MKNVEVSDELWERIMRDSQGASFDAMCWMLVRDYEATRKMGSSMLGTMLAAVSSKDKSEFKEIMKSLKDDEQLPQ